MSDHGLSVPVPPELVAAIAERVADIIDERQLARRPRREQPYLTVPEAAEVLRAKPQRVYDLLSARRLTRHKDGSRTLLSRAEIDAYLGNA